MPNFEAPQPAAGQPHDPTEDYQVPETHDIVVNQAPVSKENIPVTHGTPAEGPKEVSDEDVAAAMGDAADLLGGYDDAKRDGTLDTARIVSLDTRPTVAEAADLFSDWQGEPTSAPVAETNVDEHAETQGGTTDQDSEPVAEEQTDTLKLETNISKEDAEFDTIGQGEITEAEEALKAEEDEFDAIGRAEEADSAVIGATRFEVISEDEKLLATAKATQNRLPGVGAALRQMTSGTFTDDDIWKELDAKKDEPEDESADQPESEPEA